MIEKDKTGKNRKGPKIIRRKVAKRKQNRPKEIEKTEQTERNSKKEITD